MRALSPPAFLLKLLPTLALGGWLYAPTLDLGLYADDYVAVAALEGRFAAERAPLDLFNFADGSPEDVRALMQQGSLPWWTPPDFRVSFLRPLSSALWHVDRALFGDDLRAYHWHSLAVWALLAVVAAAVYRRLFPGWLWAFAVAAFALDHSQHFPVMWLSNRGGLYASAAGLLALHLHLRAREEGGRLAAVGSALCVAVGLLFGEWVFPLLAYILAYELVSARGGLPRGERARALALLPAGALALAFLVVRGVLGYGARGSGAYVDPVTEPLRFGAVLLGRIPVFAADMLWNVPASNWDHGSSWRDTILRWNVIPPELWIELPSWPFWHVLLGIAAITAFALLLRWTHPRLRPREQRALRFLLLGSLLSMIPVAGSFASTRLTLGAFFGIAPVLMLIVRELLRALIATPLPRPSRWAAGYLLAVALVHFQLLAPLTKDFRAVVADFGASAEWAVAAELGPGAASRPVLLLNASEFTSSFFFSYIRAFHGYPPPRAYYPIAITPHPLEIVRESADTLSIEALGGGLTTSGVETMFRPVDAPLPLGAFIALDGVSVEVSRVLAGEPRRIRLRFTEPIEQAEHILLISGERGLERYHPPAIGETDRQPRAVGPGWSTLCRARYRRSIGPLPEFLAFDPVPPFVEFEPES